uniref:Transmembrane protein n=1 Tax=Pithovirus LCPAC401 TaxID=2506595 RepID=A0A481Z986_9VIRU|nr:MAG: transmembrane protein [Pithovirus LCPAC401]
MSFKMEGWYVYSVVLFLIIAAIVVGLALFYSRRIPGDFCTLSCGDMVCELNICRVDSGGSCGQSSDCISGDVCTANKCITIEANQ